MTQGFSLSTAAPPLPAPRTAQAPPTASPATTQPQLRRQQTPATPVGTVALVAAVRDELMPVVQRLRLQADPPWFVGASPTGRKWVAGVTGVGRERAVEVLGALIEEHQPTHIIHLGFAGGLDPTLRAGVVLDIQRVIDESGQTLVLEQGVPRPVDAAPTSGTLRNASDGASRQATLLTLDRLVHSVLQKQDLYRQHRAAAVDMETFHVARLAAQRGLRLKMLRAISDPATMAIPEAAENWIRPDGTDNIPAAVWHLATHPWKVPATVRLGRNVRLAGDNLADAVEKAALALG